MERDALTDIYHATDGKYWYKKWNWCNAFERYSKWYGVVVDNGGHVQTINLRENFLRGNITSLPRLNCLKNLQVLVLSVNKITGELPCNFHELVSLEQLDLSWNQLTGRIPPTLYACSTLKILKLEHNQLEGEIIEDIQALTELVHLDLSYNRFSGKSRLHLLYQ